MSARSRCYLEATDTIAIDAEAVLEVDGSAWKVSF
jgi:hypothetical protein